MLDDATIELMIRDFFGSIDNNNYSGFTRHTIMIYLTVRNGSPFDTETRRHLIDRIPPILTRLTKQNFLDSWEEWYGGDEPVIYYCKKRV